MAKTLNRVQLIGRLGADPELRYTEGGMTMATFTIATNRQWPGKDGTMQEEVEWHSIVAWDKLAQLCSDFLTKGRLAYIEGRIHTRSYERDGQKHYKTEIVASDMLILDQRPAQANVEEREPEGETVAPRRASADRPAPRREQVAVASGSRGSRREVELDPDELPF